MCKLLDPRNQPEIIAFGIKSLAAIIHQGSHDWDFGKPQVLLQMLPVVEFASKDVELSDLQTMLINEIVRQITSEDKAVLLLSRYGISRLLNAMKKQESNQINRRLIEQLTTKLLV